MTNTANKAIQLKKVEVLNDATKQIRESMLAINVIYGKDKDIEHLIWRANKYFGELVKGLAKKLDKEVTEEAFQDIVKQIGERK